MKDLKAFMQHHLELLGLSATEKTGVGATNLTRPKSTFGVSVYL